MLRSYLASALRTLRRQRLYSTINLVGLAVGLACALSVYALLSHELWFDAYHAEADQIYRVGALWPEWDEDGASYQEQTPTGLVPLLRAGVPGIERVAELDAGYGTRSVKVGDRFFSQDGVAFVGAEYFDVFDYTLLAGGVARLAEPGTVVLAEEIARRFFGEGTAVGEVVRFGDQQPLEVVGVVADPPANTHLPFVFFASQTTRSVTYDEWGFSDGHSVYLVLSPNASPARVAERLNAIRVAHQSDEQQANQHFLLQPLRDIHTDTRYGAYSGSTVVSPTLLWGLGWIGLLVLLSAVFNYVNLATAQGVARAREIGVRKAIGGSRFQVAAQFLGETVALTSGAVAVGWCAAVVLIPYASRLFQVEIARTVLLRPEAILFTVGTALAVSALAGAYPAVVLSGYQPVAVLRGSGNGQSVGGRGVRRGLIVFQFVATLALLLGALVVQQQMSYIQSKDLGFERGERLLVRVPRDESARARFREAIEQAPAAQSITYAMGGPTKSGRLNHSYTWDGGPDEDGRSLRTVPIDAGYVATFGLRVLAGRNLESRDETKTHSRAVLINRSMAEQLGAGQPTEAIGQILQGQGGDEGLGELEVIGVVEDFHHGSLHTAIDPVVMVHWPRWTSWAGIALAPGRVAGGLADVEAMYESTFPDTHFRYEFLDDYVADLYVAERRVANAFRVFTLLAILIACLGLFGLAALAASQRIREIGIRKVLGASVASLVALLTQEVFVLVGVAFAVGGVPAYILLMRWLEGFAYRIDLGPGVFLLAGGVVLLIALATVSSQALRAATADPIRALRSD